VQAVFVCPAFSLEAPADEADIRRCLPCLVGQPDPFAIIELRGGTYMQVQTEGEGFCLEHQEVTTASHYRVEGVITADQAVSAFLSYAFGKNEWAFKHRWIRIDL